MITAGIFPFKENSHGRDGNRTRDLMISSQTLWPLDHEAGQTDYIDAYKTHYTRTIPLYTPFFLKMKPRVRNM